MPSTHFVNQMVRIAWLSCMLCRPFGCDQILSAFRLWSNRPRQWMPSLSVWTVHCNLQRARPYVTVFLFQRGRHCLKRGRRQENKKLSILFCLFLCFDRERQRERILSFSKERNGRKRWDFLSLSLSVFVFVRGKKIILSLSLSKDRKRNRTSRPMLGLLLNA